MHKPMSKDEASFDCQASPSYRHGCAACSGTTSSRTWGRTSGHAPPPRKSGRASCSELANLYSLSKNVCEESTYLVEGALEEMQVAAAHLLVDEEPKIETRYLVRILPSDVQAADLQVE